MTAERWQRIKEVFQAASELRSDQRAAYLDEACAIEPSLRREVESLLNASEEAEDFIEKPALQQSHAALMENLPDPAIGRRVGHYRLIGEVGQGGMGTVYRAVRADDHFRQEVAIKIVKRGMDTDFILRRFRNERQILAGLDHPNIARLLDGGATEDGLPYYVMEFIEGRPIDEYCDSLALPSAERLKLFVAVCAAVQYAHEKLVVHRDIKPGNILITVNGIPKLLDFGIAKILDPEFDPRPGEPTVTLTSLRMMTPAYASPEQVRGHAITPASDVYSLGVLLYELLTGHRPYRFKSRAPHELAQVICEEEPQKPSTAVGRTDEILVPGPDGSTTIVVTPESVSRTRGAEPKRLRQCLQGDLDCIVLMAMRKDPQRRYQSAQAFAADIDRHLDGRPVLARSDTASYRLGKWASRHKASAAASVTAMALAGVFGFQAYLATSPDAHVKSRPSVAVIGFKNLSGRPQSAWISTALTEMVSTELAAGEKLRTVSGETVAQVKLDLSLADADSFSRDTLSRIRNNLGADYVVLGSYLATGGNEIRLDLRLQDAVAGETVVTATDTGKESDLPALVANVGARVRERLGLGELSGSDAERIRAAAPANADAARLYSEGLRRLRIYDTLAAKDYLERASAEDPNHALTYSALALALSSLGDDAKAKAAAKRAFDLSKELSRENRLFVEGRYYETVNSWDKATEIYRALYGFFPDSLDYGLRLAAAQTSLGKGQDSLRTVAELRRFPPPARDDPRIDLEEANAAKSVSDYKRVLEIAARAGVTGLKQGSRILVARAKLLEGEALSALDQPDKAVQVLEDSRRIYAEFGHRRGTARALNALADVKMQHGDPASARKLHGEALAIFRELGNQSGIAGSVHNIAVITKQQGDFEGAKKMYREALAIRREIGERGSMAFTLNGLANTLLEQGKLGEVKEMYTESLAIAKESGAKRMIARAQTNLGLALRHQGELAAAKNLYEESIAIRRQIGDEAGLPIVLHNVSQLLQDQGDLAGAKRVEQEAMVIHRKFGNKRGMAYSYYGLGLIAFAEGDLTAAKSAQQEGLSLREAIGEKNSEAQSRLALSEVNLEEGHADLAQMFARQAATAFRDQKAVYLEASAQSMLALSLSMQKKFREAQTAVDRALLLQPQIEFQQIRIASATTLARAASLMGKHAAGAKAVEALLVEATRLGLVPNQLDIRLALGEIEIRSGDAARGRERLAALRSEAASRGYGLIARKAASLSTEP